MRLLVTPFVCCLLVRGAAAGEAAQILAPDATQPQVAVDPRGNVYVVFLHQGNVAVCVSTDRGKTFTPPAVVIDAKGKARGGMQRGPRIGADVKGNLVVTCPLTFDLKEAAKKYPVAELYLTMSADGGKTWTAPARVNEVPRMAPEALHWLAVAPDGTAHVAWLDMREVRGRQDLFYATARGGKVGKNFKVIEDVCSCCAPGLAVDAKGNSLLSYREGGVKESREIFALRSADGGASFGKPQRLNREDSNEPG